MAIRRPVLALLQRVGLAMWPSVLLAIMATFLLKLKCPAPLASLRRPGSTGLSSWGGEEGRRRCVCGGGEVRRSEPQSEGVRERSERGEREREEERASEGGREGGRERGSDVVGLVGDERVDLVHFGTERPQPHLPAYQRGPRQYRANSTARR
eukprot:3414852-Rhodomonas_salina.3